MPTDSQLRTRFFKNQADFVKLVEMSGQDRRVTLIDFGFTYLENDGSWPRKDIGFSQERWNEYRGLFRKLDIESGLARDTRDPPIVFIRVYASGGVLGSSEKGYAHSEKALSPLVNSLDRFPRESYEKTKGHAPVFGSLANNWYLYREEY